MGFNFTFHLFTQAPPVCLDLNSLQHDPLKGGTEKQETEAACDKKMDINIKRGSISSTSNTACSNPGVVARETLNIRNMIQLKQ